MALDRLFYVGYRFKWDGRWVGDYRRLYNVDTYGDVIVRATEMRSQLVDMMALRIAQIIMNDPEAEFSFSGPLTEAEVRDWMNPSHDPPLLVGHDESVPDNDLSNILADMENEGLFPRKL